MTTITLTGRPGHRVEIVLDDEDGEPDEAVCSCGTAWCRFDRTAVEWAHVHQAPPGVRIVSSAVTRNCPGSGQDVHVGRTDGVRTECLDCRRFVTTSPIYGDSVMRTVDPHEARREMQA